MTYELLNKKEVVQRLDLFGKELIIVASNIRRDRDDAKAIVKIGIRGGKAVNRDTLDLDSHATSRNTFANAAAQSLWGVKYQDPKAQELRERLMLFCEGLWDFWIGQESGKLVEGDAERSAPPWAVPGLVLKGSTGIWAGAAGSNKSTLMRVTAQSLEHGVDTIVPVIDPEPVIWVNAEESPQEHTRQLGNVNAAIGLPRKTPLYTIDARGMHIRDIAPRLERAIQERGAKHVFVDSLSRLAQGMNLNENATATLLVDSVANFGTSVSWIGHSGHENRGRLAGSKHFENAARLMVLIQSRISTTGYSPELTRGIRARVYKANGAVVVNPQYWTAGYHQQYGLETFRGASEDEWPILRCDYVDYDAREPKPCGRRTWDGVERGAIRCTRHASEESDL